MEKVNLTVRLDREMKEQVEEVCRQKDITVSQLVRSSFRRFLNDVREAEVRQKTLHEVEKVEKQMAAVSAFVRGPGAKKGGVSRRK